MTPSIDETGIPNRCISFTVSSTWGHFKRVGRTATKQTYRIPPRTTVAGMLAAIVGAERNSYYDTFQEDNASIAITPISDIRTINIPTTGVGTDPGQDVTTTVRKRRNYSLTYQNTTGDRQLHAYEVLAEPTYRIDVAVESESFYSDLREHLTAGTSVYPPSLGKSEYLATIKNVQAGNEPSQIASAESHDIDSVAPVSLSGTVPKGNVTYEIERSPAVMERDAGGRRTTKFDDYVYSLRADEPVRVTDQTVNPATVENRVVVFR